VGIWGTGRCRVCTLSVKVDGSSGVFKHLFTDVRSIFATPHELKIVSDVYPLRLQNSRKGPLPSIDDVDMQVLEEEGGVTLIVPDFRKVE
jgi:hypothetical protein